jgi:hypothetical protein
MAASMKGPRLQFIDLLRGWAGIVMIEVHVFNGMIRPELRHTGWFNLLNFVNGLVAPSFLFCAGAGFWIAIERKWDDFTRLRPPAWAFLRRLFYILVAAYFLHLPRMSFSYLFSRATQNDLERASEIARNMVCVLGMSKRLGPLTYGKRQQLQFLEGEGTEYRNYSDETARLIDNEVMALVQEGETRARDIITANRMVLEQLAQILQEKEVLNREEVAALFPKV